MKADDGQRSRRRNATWSVLDQGLSSLTNLGGVVLAAKALSSEEFGKFTVSFGVGVLLLGVTQAFVAQPLVLRSGERKRDDQQVRSALGVAGVVGTALGLVLAMASLAFPGLRAEFLVAGMCLPLLVVGDTFRFACATMGRMALASGIDLLWLALLVASGILVPLVGIPVDGPTYMAVWGISGSFAAGVAVVVAGLITPPGLELRRYFARDHLGYRFVLEFLAVRGTNQIMSLSIGFFASVAAVGALRGATTLFGPVNVLVQAATSFGAPLILQGPTGRRSRSLIQLGVVLGLVGAVVTVTLLLLPTRIGDLLLGETWQQSAELVLPLGVQAVAVGFVSAALLGVRLVRPTLSLRLQLVSTAIFLLCFGAGVSRAGVVGAAWGLGLGTVVQAAIITAGYAWAVRRQGTRTPPPT